MLKLSWLESRSGLGLGLGLGLELELELELGLELGLGLGLGLGLKRSLCSIFSAMRKLSSSWLRWGIGVWVMAGVRQG